MTNNILSNIVNTVSGVNESSFSAYDYLYDQMEQYNNLNMSYPTGNGPQRLTAILQQLFSKVSDDKTVYRPSANSSLTDPSSSPLILATSLLSMDTLLPSSSSSSTSSGTTSYYVLSLISFWVVLIVNPIVILFGLIGNFLTTYILVRCNIAKLPVSFYTVMLNISDSLNLLIPVLIFWLDNCINRTPEKGYFRDRSNFLCKALMCPDQLFAALSAWYMCAISFNRWYSVCRPSSYFFRATASPASSNSPGDVQRVHKKYSTGSMIMATSSFLPFCINFECCACLTRNVKFRQHLQAFRSIFSITLMGVLCCLYPIFMHELRSVVSTTDHPFDLKHRKSRTYAVVWKRCYYSQKHEYAYDVIGIILSCFLHILPLTFVAVMNLMIIVNLRKRQRLMTVSASLLQSQMLLNKRKKSLADAQKRASYACAALLEKKIDDPRRDRGNSQPAIVLNRKDQATCTDLSIQTPRPSSCLLNIPLNTATPKRHHSRDRTITIMLVSVALSYLILTLPYRLFWSYNVYIKRMHPEKLTSSMYLLKMHHIDHILRTIRNIHYGTNFVFFIFLSKTFRRKFRQLFIEKIFRTAGRLLHRSSSTDVPSQVTPSKHHRQRRSTSKADQKAAKRTGRSKHAASVPRIVFNEGPTLAANGCVQGNEAIPIIKLDHVNVTRYDGE